MNCSAEVELCSADWSVRWQPALGMVSRPSHLAAFSFLAYLHEQHLWQESRGCSDAGARPTSSRHESDEVSRTRHAPDGGARQVPAPTPAQVARRERKDRDFHSKPGCQAAPPRSGLAWVSDGAGYGAATARTRLRGALSYEVPAAPVPPPPASVMAVGRGGCGVVLFSAGEGRASAVAGAHLAAPV